MKFSKKQQMLGMWADVSDDEKWSKTSTRRLSKRPKNYTAPVSFVAGGVQQVGKPQYDNRMDKDEHSEEDHHVVNTSNDSEREETLSQTSSMNTHSLFKGIGAKLLLQMGYEPGKGLGKSLQGITVPVEAQIRRGRGAIGAYGPEKPIKASPNKNQDVEKTKEFKAKLSKLKNWRKTYVTEKKIKYFYESDGQVLKDGKLRPNIKTSSSDMSRVKVIDMTGPEQRIVNQHLDNSIDKFNEISFTNFALPELQYNLNLIIDMCEQNIIQNYRKTQHLSNRELALEAEKKNIEKVVEEYDKLIHTLDTVVNIITNFAVNHHEMTLNEIAEAFRGLQDQYYNNDMAYELEKLASSLIIPKLASSMARWDPLVEPMHHLDSIRQWKNIFSVKNNLDETRSTSYHQLIWSAWFPPIKRAIERWDCREPDPMIDLLEIWMSLIPKFIMDELKMTMLQKLTIEASEWDPKTDIPIYLWIHPWLPLLGDNINTEIYPIIKRKLPSASVQRQIEQKLVEVVPTVPQISLNFRDFVQKKCAERDIIFIPLGNQYQDGNQVYKIGNFKVFINDDVLYVKQKENWRPTSLNNLLCMA